MRILKKLSTKKVQHILTNGTKIVPKLCPEGFQGSPELKKSMKNIKKPQKPVGSERASHFWAKSSAQGAPGRPPREPQIDRNRQKNVVFFWSGPWRRFFMDSECFWSLPDLKKEVFASEVLLKSQNQLFRFGSPFWVDFDAFWMDFGAILELKMWKNWVWKSSKK